MRFLSVLSAGVLAAQAGAAPPNVVVVLADDLGWADLACQGSKYYETPNIDRLAAEGMRFTDAYANGPVCQPTRAALMCGQAAPGPGSTRWRSPTGSTPAAARSCRRRT